MHKVDIDINDDVPNGCCIVRDCDGDVSYYGPIARIILGDVDGQRVALNSADYEDLKNFLKRKTN